MAMAVKASPAPNHSAMTRRYRHLVLRVCHFMTVLRSRFRRTLVSAASSGATIAPLPPGYRSQPTLALSPGLLRISRQ